MLDITATPPHSLRNFVGFCSFNETYVMYQNTNRSGICANFVLNKYLSR